MSGRDVARTRRGRLIGNSGRLETEDGSESEIGVGHRGHGAMTQRALRSEGTKEEEGEEKMEAGRREE
jgi:hypothetical protein